jgi:hypothetical protein
MRSAARRPARSPYHPVTHLRRSAIRDSPSPYSAKSSSGKYADASQMVQDCFQVEVRVMTAGKVLKIDVGERAGDGMQVDDVADDEAVMPSARFGGPRCRRATMPARLPRDLAGPIPSVVLAPL